MVNTINAQKRIRLATTNQPAKNGPYAVYVKRICLKLVYNTGPAVYNGEACNDLSQLEWTILPGSHYICY